MMLKKYLLDIFTEVRLRTNSKYRVVRRVIRDRLTYIGARELILHINTIVLLEYRNIPGVFIETGCALGGSAIVIASIKNRSRPFYVYDVFGMIPSPSGHDGRDAHDRYNLIAERRATGISDDEYYGYEKDLLGKVRTTFERYGLPIEENNVSLVQGLYKDTLQIQEPVAFAHIDCDWYDSVYTSLDAITPNLSVGGVMIIDDYYAYNGCRDAVHDYFKDKSQDFEFRYSPRLMVKRIKWGTVKRGKSVLLWGASGFQNMGDEAMLAANVEILRNLLGSKFKVVVLSYHPNNTSQLHEVLSTYDFFWLMDDATKGHVRIIRALKLIVMGLKLVWNAKRLMSGKSLMLLNSNERQFLLTLANCAALLMVGGGNINDIMVRGGLIARSFTAYLARILGKPVFLGAQTIGPLTFRWTRLLARKFLESVDFVTLRETFSRALLDEIGVKHDNIKVVLDDAFNVRTLDAEGSGGLLKREGIDLDILRKSGYKIIAVIARPWWERNNKCLQLKVALEESVRFLSSQNKYYIIFVQTSFYEGIGDNDAKASLEIVKRIGMSKAENHKILTGIYNWNQLKGILGLMDFVIGTSYHSIIFAVSMGIPTVGLYADEYYRLKIGGFFDLMGFPDMAIDVNRVNQNELIDILTKCIEKEQILRECMGEKIVEMKGSSCSAAKQLASSLVGGTL